MSPTPSKADGIHGSAPFTLLAGVAGVHMLDMLRPQIRELPANPVGWTA
ncbi:hypothetical protein AAGW05_11875 [Arthrobacter sp. LAPM80]